MDQPGSPNMPAPQSYPSPSAAAVGEGAGPFFTHHQQRLPSPDELRLAAALSRPPQANMTAAIPNGGPDGGMAIAPSLQHHAHHHQLMHHHQTAADLRASGSPVEQDHESPFAGDGSSSRKRSKISRACDECRRKKIKCDATSESGMEQCSSCRRVGTRCQFSRVPMKRGPSKGYIKELAERVNTLENSMISAQSPDMSYQPNDQAGPSPRVVGDTFTTPADMTAGQSRKRTYSMAEDSPSMGYQQSGPGRRPSLGGWPTTAHDPHPLRHLPPPGPGFPNPPQTPQSSASVGEFMQKLLHAIEHRRALPADERPSGWEIIIREVPLSKQQDALSAIGGTNGGAGAGGGPSGPSDSHHHRGGLQRLADLAVGARGQHEQQSADHPNHNNNPDDANGKNNQLENSSPTQGGSSSAAANNRTTGMTSKSNQDATQRGNGNGNGSNGGSLTIDTTDIMKEGYLSILLAYGGGTGDHNNSAAANHATAAAAITAAAAGLSVAGGNGSGGGAPAAPSGGAPAVGGGANGNGGESNATATGTGN